MTIDGLPWFSALDVCKSLAMDITGSVTRWTNSLDDDEVLTLPVGGINRGLIFVSEAGLYSLILKSRKPEAKAFKKWVTAVVLPAIRKDGMYVAGEEKVSTGEMSLEEMTLKVMAGLQDKLERLTQENLEMAPKALLNLQGVCAFKSGTKSRT